MINLAVIGALGRMGKSIVRLALESGNFNITGAMEISKFKGQNYTSLSGLPCGNLLIVDDIKDIDKNTQVLIDFSSKDTILKNLSAASERKIPYVIGTTGFLDEEIEKIKSYSKTTPLLLSPNMSLGVNVMLIATKLLSKLLAENYDIEIIEGHHNQKADSPSGTAKKLLEVIQETFDTPKKVLHGREGIIGKRTKNEIGMHAVRAGSIVGEHTVLFAGNDEEIRLEHRAQSRDVFARGALKCAEFLYNKKPGFYNMNSVLGLEDGTN